MALEGLIIDPANDDDATELTPVSSPVTTPRSAVDALDIGTEPEETELSNAPPQPRNPRVDHNQFSVFGTPLPGSDAEKEGRKPLDPRTTDVLHNLNLVDSLAITDVAKRKLVAETMNLPQPIVDAMPPETLQKALDRDEMVLALEKARVTRKKMAENIEAAAVLQKQIPVMAASEQAIERLGIEIMLPFKVPLRAVPLVPEPVSIRQGLGRSIHRSALRMQINSIVNDVEDVMSTAADSGRSIQEIFMSSLEDNFGRDKPSNKESFLHPAFNAISNTPGFMFDFASRVFDKVTTTESEADAMKRGAVTNIMRAAEIYKSMSKLGFSDAAKPFQEDVERMGKEQGFFNVGSLFFQAIARNPVSALEFITEVLVEQSIPIGLSVASSRLTGRPLVGGGVMVSSAFIQERFQLPAKFIKDEFGIDVLTPEGAAEFIKREEVQKRSISFLKGRAIPIALGAGVSLGVARLRLASSGLANVALQTPFQAAEGFTSELAAQLFSDGKIVLSEAFLEGLAEAHPGQVMADILIATTNDAADKRDREKSIAFLKGSKELSGHVKDIDVEALKTASEVLGEKLKTEGVEEIFIAADEIIKFNQDDPDGNVIETLGLTEAEVQIAANEGLDVQISVESYVRHILTKEGFDALIEHTRTELDGFSPAEAKEFKEAGGEAQIIAELETKAMERITTALGVEDADLEVFVSDAEAIRTEVTAQLVALDKYSGERAHFMAMVTAQRYLVRAVRATKATGAQVSALDLFLEDNLQIRGPADTTRNAATVSFNQVDRTKLDLKDVTKSVPGLAEAAAKRQAGEITAEEYQREVDKLKTVLPFEAVPEPSTTKEMRDALDKNKKTKLGKSKKIPVGHRVGIRLDIPAYTNHGVWVPTIHGTPVGNVHEAAVHITNVDFEPTGKEQEKAAGVSQGAAKAPFARVDGDFQSADVEALVTRSQEVLNDPEWTQVGYDPQRHSFFYDRATGEPILSATEAIQVGPLILARNAVKGEAQDFLFQSGTLTGGQEVPVNELKGSSDGEVDDARWRALKPTKTKAGKFIGVPEWVKNAGGLGRLRKLLAGLTREGLPGRFWYEDSALEVLRITNGNFADAERLIGLLAIYSPQTGVFPNTGFAIKAYTQWKNGEPITVKTDNQNNKAQAWLETGKDWGGRKVNSFYLNLMKELLTKADPTSLASLAIPEDVTSQIDRATVDLWVLRALGYELDSAGNSEGLAGKYSFSENEIRRLAGVLNAELADGERRWLPHQVQAALWTAIKARYEVPSVKKATIAESVKKGFSKYDEETGKWAAPAQNTPNKRKHMMIWRKHALAAADEDVQKSVETAKGSFGTMLNRIAQHITWEAIPSASLNLDITSADPDIRQQFTEEAISLLIDDSGHDLLADLLGVPLNLAELGTGGYAGDINTNAITTLIPIKPAGAFDNQTALDYARAIQYIFKQDAVPVFRAESKMDFTKDYSVKNSQGKSVRSFPTQAQAEAEIVARREKLEASTKKDGTLKAGIQEKLDDLATWTVGGGNLARGVRISFKAPLDQATEEAFFQILIKHLGEDAGYSKINGEIVVINFRDDETGLPFVDDQDFMAGIQEMEATDGQAIGITGLAKFGSEGQYGPVHDWGADPDGQVVLDTIDTSGRPDLQSWVRDRREAFEAIVERYSGKELAARQEELRIHQPASELEQRVFNQETGKGDAPRGSFTPSDLMPDENGAPINLIQIFEKGDPTTFLHESGHFWLEQLKDDAARFKDTFEKDWLTVRKWWGDNAPNIKEEAIVRARKAKDMASVAVLQGMTEGQVKSFIATGNLRGEGTERYLSVAMHEQFARGVENYFSTGHAPSIQLADAFIAFAQWIKSVYRRMIGMDVQFSPEVVKVLDKMLATDDEIELAASQFELTGLFGTAQEAGMTKKQFVEHQAAIARSKEDSKANQLAKHIKEIERERLKWWKTEREALRDDVRTKIAHQPVYQLLWAVTQGGLADGSALPAELLLNRMEKSALEALLPEGVTLADLPRVNRAVYEIGKQEGDTSSPSAVAAAFGFGDAPAMIDALLNVVEYNAAVEAELDNRMKQAHGDMDQDAEIEAIASIHNDPVAKVMAAELAALRTTETALNPKFLKAYAQQRILESTVTEARQTKFLSAERRHAQKAGTALRKGDRADAYAHQFQRLLNHYMATEAMKFQKTFAKNMSYMRGFKSTRKKYPGIDADYVDNIRRLVDAYDFGPRKSEASKAKEELKAIMDFIIAQETDEAAIFDIPTWLFDENTKEHIRELSVGQFKELHDSVKQMEKQGKNKKKLLVGQERMDRQLTIARMRAALIGQDRALVNKLRDKFVSTDNAGLAYGVAGFAAKMDASLLKVEQLLEAIDGSPMGVWHQTIYQPFANAEGDKQVLTQQVTDLLSAHFMVLPTSIRKSMGHPVNVGDLGDGRPFTRGNLIMLAMNSGNESNLHKLVEGYKTIGWNISEDLVTEALEQLSKEEGDLIQAVWDHSEKLWPTIESIYRRENGVSPDRVEPRTLMIGGIERSGGYFPMFYDTTLNEDGKGSRLEALTALEMMQQNVGRAAVNSSMTKGRSAFVAPVSLDVTKIGNSFDMAIHYLTHYPAVQNAKRILTDPELRKDLEGKVGKAYAKELDEWVGALAANGHDKPAADWADSIVGTLTTNTTIAVLGLSYSTLGAQTLGLLTTYDRLTADDTYGLSGHAHTLRDMSYGIVKSTDPRHWQAVFALSKEMRFRLKNTDRELRSGLRKVAGKKDVRSRTQQGIMMMIAGAQLYTVDMPAWTAAYSRALRADPADVQGAVNYADRVVRISQSGGGLKDLSAMQRHRGLRRAVTMFYSFFSVLYGITRQIGQEVVGNHGPMGILRGMGRIFVVLTLQELGMALIRGELPDFEPEDEDKEGMIKYLAKQTLLAATAGVPLGRDLVSGAIEKKFGYSPTPLSMFGENVARGIQRLADVSDSENEAELMDLKTIKPLITTFGILLGLPAAQVNRTLDGWIARMDEEAGWSYMDLLRGYDEDRAERNQR